MPSVQSKTWCFTAFENFVVFDESTMKYLCYQFEVSPTTGKKHQQGYVEFITKKALGGAKKILGSKVHLEIRRGTQQQAIEYCKKPKPAEVVKYDDDCFQFKEFGVPIKQGERKDLVSYVDDIKKGKTEYEMMEEHTNTWARYGSLYSRVRQMIYSKKPKPVPFVWVLHGSPGTGKSKIANIISQYIEDEPYIMSGNYKWWENYENNMCIIMDDYEGQLQHKDLLQLLDRYKCKREKKNGTVYITSPIFFITCNDMSWNKDEAVNRRLTITTEVVKPVEKKHQLSITF